MFIRFRGKRSGASLMEILVVVTILIVISSVFAFASHYLIIRAKCTKSYEDMRVLAQGVEHFQADKGQYPDSEEGFSVLQGTVNYVQSIPKDPFGPKEAKDYVYISNPEFHSTRPFIIAGAGPNGKLDIEEYVARKLKAEEEQELDDGFQPKSATIELNPDDHKLLYESMKHLTRTDWVNLTYDPTNGVVSFGDIILDPAN